jgi:hypothetical protein
MKYSIRTEDVFVDKGTFAVGDDEFIVDSEFRGPHRVVLAVATPTQFRCDECGDTFDSEKGLKIHSGSQH